MNKIEEEIELKEVRKSAEDFSNELGGVASRVDALSLAKMSANEYSDNIVESIENTEFNATTQETTEMGSTKSFPIKNDAKDHISLSKTSNKIKEKSNTNKT